MSLSELAAQQGDWFGNWFVFRQPLGALIFFIAATAEANRTPFDLTEADSEIVAGLRDRVLGDAVRLPVLRRVRERVHRLRR